MLPLCSEATQQRRRDIFRAFVGVFLFDLEKWKSIVENLLREALKTRHN